VHIVGTGFLAGEFRRIADRHDDVALLAAGVSATMATSQEPFQREADLLYRCLDECRTRGSRLVFFSTASTGMYSRSGREGREDGPIQPTTAYGRHKLAMEAVIRSSGVDHLILRLAHVVGRRQRPHLLLPALVTQVVNGRVQLHRQACRDVIDIDDVVGIVDRLLNRGTGRTVVNIASGIATPVERIVDHIADRLHLDPERVFVAGSPNPPISLARLRRLVPAVRECGFDDGYYRRVLDKYIDSCVPAAVRRVD